MLSRLESSDQSQKTSQQSSSGGGHQVRGGSGGGSSGSCTGSGRNGRSDVGSGTISTQVQVRGLDRDAKETTSTYAPIREAASEEAEAATEEAEAASPEETEDAEALSICKPAPSATS